MSERPANRLADATSPYLLQHAHNPVDWYPWGEEALAAARERDVPIFLSVGYAACHWCHVMERESFEDEQTAALLNERFVPIKVDREERPDVDAIYMGAVQAMTGSGGWPMSVFLTPDGQPFYAGTYFPDQPRHGLPSFRQVLEGLSEAWASQRSDVLHQAGRVTSAVAGAMGASEQAELAPARIADGAFEALRSQEDPRWGGFGDAPKFPQAGVLAWLLRRAARGSDAALAMTRRALDGMADGGIHDQVGGGFARYSVDARWHVPHFEKMLYDNAQLLQLYTHAWLLMGEERDAAVAARIAEYLLAEMQLPDGGFAASQDADSEGVEGRYYVWDFDELVAAVGPAVADAFGASPQGNWEGTNVLWRPEPLEVIAERHGLPVADLRARVEDGRHVLAMRRDARVRPATDDKVVTAWNGLAIRALAVAARALDRPAYLDAAICCATFVWDALHEGERLQRAWRSGRRSPVPGFLDDHALLGLGLLSLYESTGNAAWFRRARELADRILLLFTGSDGSLFQTGDDAERLVIRPRDVQDNAVASGGSAAAELLVRLSLLTGDARYEGVATRAMASLGDLPARAPTAFGDALCVLDLLDGPAHEVAIVGTVGEPATEALVQEVTRKRFLPNVVLAVGDDGDDVPLLDGRIAVDGGPTAYVCERFACRLPVTDPATLAAQLEQLPATGPR